MNKVSAVMFKHWLAVVGFCLFSFSAHGDAALAVKEGIVDEARVMFEQPITQQEQSYRMVLSAIRRVNNEWRAGSERQVRARVARKTYELKDPDSFGALQTQLERRIDASPKMQWVFRCLGLDCGSSNGWANEFFQIKQLHGLDNSQFYAVLQESEDARPARYHVIYLVQRGNRRVYLQWDTLIPTGSSEAQLTSALLGRVLEENRYMVLPGASIRGGELVVTEAVLAAVRDFLQQNPRARLRLVGHDYESGELSAQKERSLGYAQQALEAIVKEAKDIDRQRLSAHGVGSLAPAGGSRQARIVLLLH